MQGHRCDDLCGRRLPLSPRLAPLLCLTAALHPPAMLPTADAQRLLSAAGSGQDSARRAAAQGPRAEEWAEMREPAQEADLALELVTVEVTTEVIV